MFDTYQIRPTTTRAIRITADNYEQVADWITDNIADAQGAHLVAPGTQGQGRPRITFTARHAAPHTGYRGVPIPGVLTVTDTPDGPVYAGHEIDDFDVVWELADSYPPEKAPMGVAAADKTGRLPNGTVPGRREEALQLWQATWEEFGVKSHHGSPTELDTHKATQQIESAIHVGHEQEWILQAAHQAGAMFRTDLDYFLPRS